MQVSTPLGLPEGMLEEEWDMEGEWDVDTTRGNLEEVLVEGEVEAWDGVWEEDMDTMSRIITPQKTTAWIDLTIPG